MTENKIARILFVLCAAALILPWFTYSGTMMGYSWIAAALNTLFFAAIWISTAKDTSKGKRT